MRISACVALASCFLQGLKWDNFPWECRRGKFQHSGKLNSSSVCLNGTNTQTHGLIWSTLPSNVGAVNCYLYLSVSVYAWAHQLISLAYPALSSTALCQRTYCDSVAMHAMLTFRLHTFLFCSWKKALCICLNQLESSWAALSQDAVRAPLQDRNTQTAEGRGMPT